MLEINPQFSKEIPLLTVTELTQAIKSQLEKQFPYVALQGEVSNCKQQSSGHLYFSIKDSNSQIATIMFRLNAIQLPRMPKDGDQVVVKGALNVYPPNGKYQLIIEKLEFAGLGQLLLRLDELKRRLHKLGYFRTERKKSLPKNPKKIGIITSPTGAVIQDILNVLKRRATGFHLILNPVKVQGEGAAQEISHAIDYFNQYRLVDVMIIGRGGGSIEDLWAFNEELVAGSIYRSQIPIISAVGHETDHCIADYVADVRAPTPSAAAEIVTAEQTTQLKTLSQLEKGIQQTVFHLLKNARDRLNSIKRQPEFQTPYGLLGPSIQKLDEYKNLIDRTLHETLTKLKLRLHSLEKQKEALKPTAHLAHLKQKFNFLERELQNSFKKVFSEKKSSLEQVTNLLRAIDPKNLLSKGYSIIFSEKRGSIINSIRAIEKGENVKLLFADGEAQATINEIHT